MNMLRTGNTYQLTDDNVEVLHTLPANTYVVKNTKTGPILVETAPYGVGVSDANIAGDVNRRIMRIARAYTASDKSLGCILSGVAGVGKTMLARLLSAKLAEQDIPTILVTTAEIPHLPQFLLDLHFSALVVFDEFDKVFDPDFTYDTDQVDLLTYFDDTNPAAKHLNLVLVNDPTKLLPQMRSRPGRFRYLMQIDEPTHEDIRAYAKAHGIADIAEDLCALSIKTPITYDILNQIALEHETFPELPFAELLRDLNIATQSKRFFDVHVTGTVTRSQKPFSTTVTKYMDEDDDDIIRIYKIVDSYNNAIDLNFSLDAVDLNGDVDVERIVNSSTTTTINAIHVKRVNGRRLAMAFEK